MHKFSSGTKKILYGLFFSFFSGFFLCACAGDLTRKAFTVHLESLPREFHQKKIVFFADLHLRKETINEPLFQRLTEKVNQEEPDLILIAGDIVDQTIKTYPEEFVHIVTAYLKKFHSKYGIFLCNGNHELAVGRELLNTVFQAKGLFVLSDAFFFLNSNGKHLVLYGAPEPFYTKEEKEEKLRKKKKIDGNNPPLRITDNFLSQRKSAGAASPLILLSHRPELFDLLEDDQNIFMLAGHHHGGIVDLPFLPAGTLLSWYKKRRNPKFKGLKYVYGHYRKGRKHLFVTSGVSGGDHSALRINVPREYVVITLAGREQKKK